MFMSSSLEDQHELSATGLGGRRPLRETANVLEADHLGGKVETTTTDTEADSGKAEVVAVQFEIVKAVLEEPAAKVASKEMGGLRSSRPRVMRLAQMTCNL